MVSHFTNVSGAMAWSGSPAGGSLMSAIARHQSIWMDMALARRSGQELHNSYVVTNSPEYAPLRRFFKAAVDGLQLIFDRSLVTSVQPRSVVNQDAGCGGGL